jgi:predicted short-subunit dehydrogenase-like oxidoreductase (DUF2520 family)
MKSTASAALASLKHKFQAKIVEVGKLKRETARLTQLVGAQAMLSPSAFRGQSEQLAAQLRANTALEAELAAQDAVLTRQVTRANTAENLLRHSKSSVENWKSLAVVLCIVGVVLGGLSQYAYSLNVVA